MNVKEVNTEELEEGKTKIFVKSPETIFLLEEKLFQKLDPEGMPVVSYCVAFMLLCYVCALCCFVLVVVDMIG